MIGAILGLAAGLASGIAGGVKSAKAAKKQQELVDQQRAENDAWYNRNYYQNYLDSTEARAAMKRVEDTLRRRNQEAQAQAAISGGTPEQVIAQQENDQKLVGDVATNLAARGDEIKRQVDAQYMANKANIAGQQMNQYQMNEAGGAQLLGNGGSLIGSALSMFGDGKSGDWVDNLFGIGKNKNQ